MGASRGFTILSKKALIGWYGDKKNDKIISARMIKFNNLNRF